jgi:hypothetical protein
MKENGAKGDDRAGAEGRGSDQASTIRKIMILTYTNG